MGLKNIADAFNKGFDMDDSEFKADFTEEGLHLEGKNANWFVDKILGQNSTKMERMAYYAGTAAYFIRHPIVSARFFSDMKKIGYSPPDIFR